MYIAALIQYDWTCCYVNLSVFQPAPKHLEPISCFHCAFLNTVVPVSSVIHTYSMLLQVSVNWSCTPFWNISTIALVTVKYASNSSLKSVFVDKFIDLFENWKKTLLCHVGGIW